MASCGCGPASHDCLARGLIGGEDHVAINRTVPVDLLEINFLNELEADFASGDLAGDEYDERPVATCPI
jgi:hypothetical protein